MGHCPLIRWHLTPPNITNITNITQSLLSAALTASLGQGSMPSPLFNHPHI